MLPQRVIDDDRKTVAEEDLHVGFLDMGGSDTIVPLPERHRAADHGQNKQNQLSIRLNIFKYEHDLPSRARKYHVFAGGRRGNNRTRHIYYICYRWYPRPGRKHPPCVCNDCGGFSALKVTAARSSDTDANITDVEFVQQIIDEDLGLFILYHYDGEK